MNTSIRPNKSTTVRAQPIALRAARAGFRVLSPHAPELAARWAERLFLTARRHERPFWEADALRSARQGRVAHEDGWLPTWTWSPGVETSRTVLLVHGWEGRGSQLAAFVPALLARGFRVVTFDAPGHGDSPLRRASLVEHARALSSVARAVGPVYGIVGHSVGGAATLLATRFGLEASRIALVAPPTAPAKFAATFARTLGLEDSVRTAMIARLESRYAIPFDDLNVRTDAERLYVPLLVVHDHEDPVVGFEEGKLLANRAPRGEFVPVTGLGHRAILRAPYVVETIANFIDDGVERSTFAETLDGELFMRNTRWQTD
ncbi:MAG TPA: alpha/beta fold hydrolase [Labilithrix sp.]|nr:alpha/beta fold hydrolase [Labilithrix sp.]